MTLARFITDFADQAVILPLALAVGLCHWAAGWRRGCAAWGGVVCATLALVLALKIGFGLHGPASESGLLLRSPSGHTAAAGVVYGGLLAILIRRVGGRVGWAVLCAAAAAALVGATRSSLGAHSAPEILLGGAVGVAGAAVLAGVMRDPPSGLRAPLAAVALAVVLAFHGLHLPAEAYIRHAISGSLRPGESGEHAGPGGSGRPADARADAVDDAGRPPG